MQVFCFTNIQLGVLLQFPSCATTVWATNAFCSLIHHREKANSFCATCAQLYCDKCLKHHDLIDHYHDLLRYYFNVQCTLHRRNYCSYCLQCKLELCADCEGHQAHKLAPIYPVSTSLINKHLALIADIITFNQLLKEDYTKRLARNVQDNTLAQANQVKEKLDRLYDSNSSANLLLWKLVLAIQHTAFAFQCHLCHYLFTTYQSLKFNSLKELSSFSMTMDIKSYCNKVELYLMNHYIIEVEQSIKVKRAQSCTQKAK